MKSYPNIKKSRVIAGFFLLLLLIFSVMSCLQTVSPELGALQLILSWENQESDMNAKAVAVKASLKENSQISGSSCHSKVDTTDISRIRVKINPGDMTFIFTKLDTAIKMDLDLGIYNIAVEALDNQGRCMYQGEAEKILVENLKITYLQIFMNPNFPFTPPEFIGLSEMNENSTGDYQLLWTSSLFADTYSLEESSDSSFSSTEKIYSGPDTVYSITEHADGIWYYRVNGKNDIAESPWSQTVAFHVQYIPLLDIMTDTLANAKKGTFYTDSVSVTGGALPYTWSVSSGTLPTGLSLDAETGIISGTPTAVDEWTFTVQVTDNSDPQQSAEKSFSINVVPEDLAITTSSLPDGTQGTFYSQNIDAEGGSTDWSWSMTDGTLPSGVTFVDFGETGRVHGTPTESGTFNFTIQITDNVYPDLSDTKSFSLTINPSTLNITTTSLPGGQVDVAYSQTVNATGGTTPYTWSISSGTLPYGLSLNAGTGQISGTPTSSDEWAFTIRVTDNSSPSQSDTQELSINIDQADLEITTGSPLPDYKAGTDYNKQINASGGTLPYIWTLINRSPLGFAEGLNLSTSGVLSGNINAQPETGQLTIKVTDNESPSNTDTKVFDLTIIAGDLDLFNVVLPHGKVGSEYWGYIFYRYGTSPLESPWTITGDWPLGVTMSYDNNNYKLDLGGWPINPGTYNFTVTIRDSGSPQQSRTDSFTIIIDP